MQLTCVLTSVIVPPSPSQSVYDVLLPHLDVVTGYVQSLLESAEPSQQESALRVYETLLVSHGQLSSEVFPYHPSITTRLTVIIL